ncbi:MAG: cytochrome c [Betaproteobacteria bacterium]|jgi:cytochrome c553|nr:cytochrome c [Betaproteobacteria bacterium]MBK6601968.1 cytochrome c [Betaproteobacteria bacterium]MBK7082738.1 cytochrome c [Betaproteobacteria bacterium]MBK7591827.1 cytochrome c [Betaproteobacteria bacterium]MBK8690204.1 cytochrome c [Betaproteobacteria bacterium]
MNMKLPLSALLLALAWVPPAHATDLAAGAAKAKEVCVACHGIDGNSPSPEFPRLAGQHRDYLEKALRDYKSGARKNAIMAGFAAALTPRDIENVAAHYHSQPSVLATRY